MPGIRSLRKIQLGLESAPGTAVAATTIWRGIGTLEDKRKVIFPDEDIGVVGGVDRVYTPSVQGGLEMEAVPATFEQLPYILAAGVKDVVTGAADGSGTDKIYTYTFPTTTLNSIKTYTIEGGDNQAAEKMEYSFVESFNLSGKAGEAVMMSASWTGRQVSSTTFTAALAVPTVEDILFSKGKLYIDAIGETIGTTLQSSTFLGMNFTVKTGWIPVFTGDGNLYFTFHKMTAPEITCEITFEHDAVGVARKTDWGTNTARLIRMQFEGSSVATGGTQFQKKTLRIDMASKIEKVGKLDEQDGNDILKVTFRPRYNSTAAKYCEITVVNELTTLP